MLQFRSCRSVLTLHILAPTFGTFPPRRDGDHRGVKHADHVVPEVKLCCGVARIPQAQASVSLTQSPSTRPITPEKLGSHLDLRAAICLQRRLEPPCGGHPHMLTEETSLSRLCIGSLIMGGKAFRNQLVVLRSIPVTSLTSFRTHLTTVFLRSCHNGGPE